MLNLPDELDICENDRNDRAINYNNKIQKNVNIVRNAVMQNSSQNYENLGMGYINMYTPNQQYTSSPMRHYTSTPIRQYNNIDDDINTNLPISLYFAKKETIPVKDLFDMYLLDGYLRLFVPKNLPHWQVLNIMNQIDIGDPKTIGYEMYADCILPIYLDYQDKFTLAN